MDNRMGENMDELLEKLRRINYMLQKEGGFVAVSDEATDLPFTEMASVLGDILMANTYLIDLSGNLLGYSEATDINNARIKQMLEDKKFPEHYAQNLSALIQTTANIGIESDFTAFPIESRDLFIMGVTTVVPIFASGKRLGSLILARMFPAFDSSDLILAEHGATVIGIELLHTINLRMEEATRVTTLIQIAVKSLSFSELEAVKAIFETFPSLEERITASRIAAEKNITRSVIVNALRKLESAGILETRSLGMKGTFIRVVSAELLDALKKALYQKNDQ